METNGTRPKRLSSSSNPINLRLVRDGATKSGAIRWVSRGQSVARQSDRRQGFFFSREAKAIVGGEIARIIELPWAIRFVNSFLIIFLINAKIVRKSLLIRRSSNG